MNVCRMRSFRGRLEDYIRHNKKYLFSFTLLFLLGIAIGILAVINAYGGEFAKVTVQNMTYSSVKVFFISVGFLALFYLVILISCCSAKLIWLAVLPFLALGFMYGRYMVLLIACYGAIGVLNLIFIYTIFYISSWILLMIGAVAGLRSCGCESTCYTKIRPCVILLGKAFCLNLAIAFLVFLVLGAIFKVIVVPF